MSILSRNDEPSQEELMEMQREAEKDRENRQTANNIAQSVAREQAGDKPGYWSVLTEPDISSGVEEYDQHISDFLSTEMSGQLAIGNISKDDWESFCWRTEYEFWMIRNEFQDQDSKLDDLDLAAMGYGSMATLDDSMARRLRSAEQVRKQMLSNSVEGVGRDSGTEIHVATRNEDSDDDNDGDGGGGGSGWRGWLSR